MVRHQKTPVEKKPLPFSSMAINANWRICWVIRLLFLWLSHPVLLWTTTFSSISFCPSYNLQATHPDSRNMEGSVLFTILITLYLSWWRFSCCTILITLSFSRYTVLITLNPAVHSCSLLFTIVFTLSLVFLTFKLFQND